MSKHFENIWEEAETISHDCYASFPIEKIKELLNSDLTNVDNFGELLFMLCWISKKHNINAWSSLKQAIIDHKIDLLESSMDDNINASNSSDIFLDVY